MFVFCVLFCFVFCFLFMIYCWYKIMTIEETKVSK